LAVDSQVISPATDPHVYEALAASYQALCRENGNEAADGCTADRAGRAERRRQEPTSHERARRLEESALVATAEERFRTALRARRAALAILNSANVRAHGPCGPAAVR
jgi:hypothetical protein